MADTASPQNGFLGIETGATVLHTNFAWLVEILEWAAAGIDLAAILLLLIGGVRFIAQIAVFEFAGAQRMPRMARARAELGRYILAGLEIFIVSDIIHVALSLSLADLLFLGLLVVIRSIVSFFLDRELEHLRRELGDDA